MPNSITRISCRLAFYTTTLIMLQLSRWLAISSLFGLLVACGEPAPVGSCTAGETRECVCSTGSDGEAVCGNDGVYGECTCFGRGGPTPTPDVEPTDVGPAPDSGEADASEDVAADVTEDPTQDTTPDAEPDAEPDVGEPDAEPDAIEDTVPDAEPDAIEDTTPDAEPDADPDVPLTDVEPDALEDTAPDTEPDVRTDVPEDIGPFPACSAFRDPCDGPEDTTADFFCDETENRCLARCDFTTANATVSADCPANSYCLIELTGGEPDELNGACVPGDCVGSIFDPRGCEADETCLAVGHGASFCIPAGTAAVGEECDVSDLAEPPESDTCEPGLRCLFNSCVEPCRLGAGCAGTDTCVAVFDSTPSNRAGTCGTRCPDFGTCASGTCEPAFGRFGITNWICDERDVPRGAEGEPCVGAAELCEEGLTCLDIGTPAVPEPTCVVECEPGSDCAAGDICVNAAADGFGFCLDECSPYPRSSTGCAADDTCFPFVSDTTRAVEPEGYCSGDPGTVGAGGLCPNPGFLGGACEDFAVCLDLAEDGSGECLPLCDPFASGQCSSYPSFSTCSGVPPLVGELAFSFCTDAQPGSIGGFCFEEGFPCSADGSLCLDMTGFGAECLQVCRVGFPDCDSGTCRTDGLNPDVVPPYMGLCR